MLALVVTSDPFEIRGSSMATSNLKLVPLGTLCRRAFTPRPSHTWPEPPRCEPWLLSKLLGGPRGSQTSHERAPGTHATYVCAHPRSLSWVLLEHSRAPKQQDKQSCSSREMPCGSERPNRTTTEVVWLPLAWFQGRAPADTRSIAELSALPNPRSQTELLGKRRGKHKKIGEATSSALGLIWLAPIWLALQNTLHMAQWDKVSQLPNVVF